MLFGVTLAFEIMANHPQITFYLGMVVLCYGLARLYVAIRERAVPAFLKTAGVLVVAAGAAGLCVRAAKGGRKG